MRTILLVGGLVAALMLNVATVAIGSVAAVVSGVVEAVTGVASVKTRLTTDLEVSNRKVAALEAEVERLKPRQVTYRGQKKLLEEAVADTTERVSRRTAVGASRNVAATFGEAVPMVGIGVVVAATVWELTDACETMKDLQALEVAMDPGKARADDVTEVCGLTVPSKEEIWAKMKTSPGEAWGKAKEAMPDLPEMPKVDWTPWN